MARRDARRDDGDRPPRRDRDLFDDRGGRGGRGGGQYDRDAFAQQRGADRKKSMSPPPKKKEPTPDLTDVVPVTERKRRLTQWDIKPPGYENVTAEQAKLSGTLASTAYSRLMITCCVNTFLQACSRCLERRASSPWIQVAFKPL